MVPKNVNPFTCSNVRPRCLLFRCTRAPTSCAQCLAYPSTNFCPCNQFMLLCGWCERNSTDLLEAGEIVPNPKPRSAKSTEQMVLLLFTMFLKLFCFVVTTHNHLHTLFLTSLFLSLFSFAPFLCPLCYQPFLLTLCLPFSSRSVSISLFESVLPVQVQHHHIVIFYMISASLSYRDAIFNLSPLLFLCVCVRVCLCVCVYVCLSVLSLSFPLKYFDRILCSQHSFKTFLESEDQFWYLPP